MTLIKKLTAVFCISLTLCSAGPMNSPNGLYSYIKRHKDDFQGWCSDEKSVEMAKLILETKPKVCVEIGVFGGSSIFPTALALKYNKHGDVFAIDPWSNSECTKHHLDGDINKEYWGSLDLASVYHLFLSNLKKHDIQSRCIVMKKTSKAAASLVPSKIDILHIDGNHQEEACYYDTLTYFPKVKKGGYIWFDDMGWTDPITKKRTTKRSYEYLTQYCDLVMLVDKGGCALLQKHSNPE